MVAPPDAQPPRGGGLPTPGALPGARAGAVLKILERTLGAERLTAEGRGEREPLAPNTTPANRGANRRVDVRLYPE
ncbi:hypothetical protein GAY29_30255 [Azospirillum brasilense]|nr:hypothetical protein [Azospirillum brasilense]